MNALTDLIGFIKHQTESFRLMLHLVSLEAKLAGLTVFPLLMCFGFLCMFCLTLWLSVMGLMGYLVNVLTQHTWLAFLFVIIINSGLIFICLIKLSQYKSDMSFEKTRAYFTAKQHE